MTVEMLLYKILMDQYPPENLMMNLFKELGKTFNYQSNKYLAEILAKYLIENNKFKILITSANNNLGDIIFNEQKLCIDYFFLLFDLNDNLLEKKIDDCEKNVFQFFKNEIDVFKIPEECFTNIDSLSDFLSKYKEENDSVQKIDNKSKDSQDTQGIDKKDIKEGEVNQFKEQDCDEEKNEIKKMMQEMDEMKKCLIELLQAKDKQSKVNARANIKIQELDSKIFTIQSGDLWKGIINYHLYHLDIIKRGNNEEKINQKQIILN